MQCHDTIIRGSTLRLFYTTAVIYYNPFLYRNNLTIIEVVSLEGRGVTPQLEIDGHEAGGSLPITFEYTEKMLSHCDGALRLKS